MSDTFDMKEVDGIVYEIESRKVTKGGEHIGTFVSLPFEVRAVDQTTEASLKVMSRKHFG
jgi:hypothetical protein